MTQRRCFGCMQLITEEVCPHCGTAADDQNASDQLPVGTLLRGQYLVGRVLGQGGFGITYIGMDTYLEEVVAIKEFFPTSAVNRDVSQTCNVQLNSGKLTEAFASGRDRFLREAKILTKLRGIPEIVDIRTMFPENNTAYIVMEYVRGIDLREYVRRRGGRLSVEETLKLLEPIAYALDMVHQEGLVHRDVSPDNIMLQPNGRTKLLDFGASRDAGDADADRDLTHSTEAILKHGFAPMEQYNRRGNLGPWTDEYSFCATIYYCLTGLVPPEASVRITEDEHPRWDSIKDLTQRQREALEKGMSLRAVDRFGSIETLHRALYVSEYQSQTQLKSDFKTNTIPDQKGHSVPVGEQEKKTWLPLSIAVVLALLVGLTIGGKKPAGDSGTTMREHTSPEQTSTECSHIWIPADCTTPKTCSECGETDGEAAGHDWMDADYNHPQKCAMCGVEEGEKKKPSSSLRLRDIVVDAKASSVYSGDKLGEHDPENLFDGKTKTNWTENDAGKGIGEYVCFYLDGTYAINKLYITIGSHFNEVYYYRNCRPKAITLMFTDGSSEYIELEDTYEEQEIKLKQYYYTDYIKVTIEEVYSGTDYTDAVIAELDFKAYKP